MKPTRFIIISSVILVLLYNFAFFRNVTSVYNVTMANIPFLGSIVIVLGSLIALLFSLMFWRYTTKPILIAVLLASSVAGYFMDSYNVIIDSTMIQSSMLTDSAELMDLVSIKLLLYLCILGVLPAILVYRSRIDYAKPATEIVSRLKLVIVLIVVIASQLLLFGKAYASFFREHKELRYFTNPVTFIYSTTKYVNSMVGSENSGVMPVGLDAAVSHGDGHRELTILVIGETVRADRLSLNGYSKTTTPLLEKENVISFTNMHSCGTSTAVSVPCMFSMYAKDEYDDEKGRTMENLLDVLSHAGVFVLWRDNNSDSKGVALRVQYEDYKSPDVNTDCDIECRDDGMLVGLQDYIDAHPEGDILIVLHQMGAHGPAYYKRYPQIFEMFTPVCRTNHLDECSEEEINNAYDNSILYTDYFLSRVISLLKQYMDHFETAMLYVSDHGESLGESGIYLHGLPYFMAPDNQTHVASVFWFGENYDEIDVESVKQKANLDFSHDNLFHTVLGLMEVETEVYNKDLDIINSDQYKQITAHQAAEASVLHHQAFNGSGTR